MTSDTEQPAAPGVDWEGKFRAGEAPWERAGVHPAFHDWVKAGVIAPGLSVLVPGCGRSAEPEAFARLGLGVTGTDMAPSAITWQEARFARAGLEGRFLVTDALAWRPGAPFDLVYEQTFLCAIHPHLRPDWEEMARASLKPGGRLLALFMQKEERGGPPYGCEIEAMRDLLPDSRWRWPEGELKPWPHPSLGGKAELGAVLERL